MRSLPLLFALLGAAALLPLAAAAQGGPPFLTDDPETPGANRWEINFGFLGARSPSGGAYQLPDFDINYGLGDRIQLKYELPIALSEQRPTAQQAGTFNAGLGESLLGIKWRFFQHHPGDPVASPFSLAAAVGLLGPNPAPAPPAGDEPAPPHDTPETPEPSNIVDFSVSTYPQLYLNNPIGSIARNVVAPGPDLFLPLEVNGRVGPLRLDTEVGYHFGNRNLPQSWIRGLLVGHEFSERTELYLELYDQQDANRVRDRDGVLLPKQRSSTLGAGGRQALTKRRNLLLLFMGGRSFQTPSGVNGQPSFIAYLGLQLLLGKQEEPNPQVEQKLPDENPPKPVAGRPTLMK